MTRVAVIGAGTMGHAIALVFALGGHQVRLTDNNPATLERAQGLMETALATLVKFGEAPADRNAAWLRGAVTRHASLAETVADAELIIEAIIERPDAKRALYAELDKVAPAEAIWASNTSYLDVFPLIPEGRQRRAMIAHWYTPPYLVDLCDLVPGPKCDPAVVERVRGMVTAMGQVPIVMRKFVPGYVANRVQAAIQAEVQKLLDDGVGTAQEIDAAIIHGIALRLPILGVFAKADFTGLQLMYDAARNRSGGAGEGGPGKVLTELVESGKTGVLSGAGFYDWSDRTPAEWFEDRDRRLVELKRALRKIGSLAGFQEKGEQA
ncbi:MAG: 3-hydroxyacyl-CoA dehydrogenase family protein [Acetobacteraceae bacterium]|nr:3-hydroxyacyl-CoA dehydrogenase family protein [Acetobacteraceae bacterium]